MDNLTKEQRKKTMSLIRSEDTKAEIILRKELWKRGYRFRKNYKKLIGKPDIAIVKYKTVIFCDGEFWHGKHWEENKKKINTNREYWIPKIERNIKRDKEINEKLINEGWKVLRFWSKDIKKELEMIADEIEKKMKED